MIMLCTIYPKKLKTYVKKKKKSLHMDVYGIFFLSAKSLKQIKISFSR